MMRNAFISLIVAGITILTVGCSTMGRCVSGNCRNGEGTFRYYDCGTYKGQFKNGKFNGKGIMINRVGYQTEHTRYEGDWKNGKRNGKGTCDYLYSDARYEGNWKNDMAEGEGTYTSPDIKYTGQWSRHKMHGRGTIQFIKVKIAYTGNFSDGKILLKEKNNHCVSGNCQNGVGLYILKDGTYYAGSFLNGKVNGIGGQYDRYFCAIYYGSWKDNKRDGKGMQYYALGKIIDYEGLWRGNSRHGSGISYYSNGNKHYEGGWDTGNFEGNGTLYYDNGMTKTVCVWKNHKKNGPGAVYNRDGTIDEEGRWEMDRFVGRCIGGNCDNGYGIFKFRNDDVYMGMFINRMREGYGTLHYSNGDYWKGTWRLDRPFNGLGALVLDDEKYIGPIVNGVRDGFGILVTIYGRKLYKGDWKNDKREGEGIEYKSGRPYYKGQWKSDKYNGQGTIY